MLYERLLVLEYHYAKSVTRRAVPVSLDPSALECLITTQTLQSHGRRISTAHRPDRRSLVLFESIRFLLLLLFLDSSFRSYDPRNDIHFTSGAPFRRVERWNMGQRPQLFQSVVAFVSFTSIIVDCCSSLQRHTSTGMFYSS